MSKTTATVHLTLAVTCRQPWPEDATVAQVREQAVREARMTVQKAIESRRDVHLLEQEVTHVLTTLEDEK